MMPGSITGLKVNTFVLSSAELFLHDCFFFYLNIFKMYAILQTFNIYFNMHVFMGIQVAFKVSSIDAII